MLLFLISISVEKINLMLILSSFAYCMDESGLKKKCPRKLSMQVSLQAKRTRARSLNESVQSRGSQSFVFNEI